jgi:hypothetical protein
MLKIEVIVEETGPAYFKALSQWLLFDKLLYVVHKYIVIKIVTHLWLIIWTVFQNQEPNCRDGYTVCNNASSMQANSYWSASQLC